MRSAASGLPRVERISCTKAGLRAARWAAPATVPWPLRRWHGFAATEDARQRRPCQIWARDAARCRLWMRRIVPTAKHDRSASPPPLRGCVGDGQSPGCSEARGGGYGLPALRSAALRSVRASDASPGVDSLRDPARFSGHSCGEPAAGETGWPGRAPFRRPAAGAAAPAGQGGPECKCALLCGRAAATWRGARL